MVNLYKYIYFKIYFTNKVQFLLLFLSMSMILLKSFKWLIVNVNNYLIIPIFTSRIFLSFTGTTVAKISSWIEILEIADIATPATMIALKNAFASAYVSIWIGGLVSISFFLLLSTPVWLLKISPEDFIMLLENFKMKFLLKTPSTELNILEVRKDLINVKLDFEKDLKEMPLNKTSLKFKVWDCVYYSTIIGGTVGLIVFAAAQISLDSTSIQSLINAFFRK